MRELRFEGLSDDGTRLVLVGKDGQRWSVVIDERMEAAVRRDRARLGQVEIEQSGELRPREIQARIRAGATAEDVAAASGLPLERIRRFEGPVLTKRAWIAQQAGQVTLRRPSGDIALAELVTERLAEQGVAGEDITWDSWQPDDGAWTVIAAFPLGPNRHVATWQYDTSTRTVTPVDDNAEDLSALPEPTKLRLVASRPQLTAVSSGPVSSGPVSAGPVSAGPVSSGAADEHTPLLESLIADDGADVGIGDRAWPDLHDEATREQDAAADPEQVDGELAETSALEPESQSIDAGLSQLGQPAASQDGSEDSEITPIESDSAPRPQTPRNLRRSGKRVGRHPSGSQLPSASRQPSPLQPSAQQASAQQASASQPTSASQHPGSAPRSATIPEPPEPPGAASDEPAIGTQTDPNTKAKPGRTAVPSFDDILFGPAPKH